jgi:hypothetical protein
MTLNINDDNISGNHTAHTARLLPGGQNQWEVSWLPGQPMDRSHALTAIALADMVKDDEKTAGRLSPDIIDEATQVWAPRNAEPSDPEAGG